MEDVKDKACPFRVHSVQHMPMLRGNGPSTTQEFYPCMGDGCAAYSQGACLRLSPPALVIDDGISNDDLKEIQEHIRNSEIHFAFSGGYDECPF